MRPRKRRLTRVSSQHRMTRILHVNIEELCGNNPMITIRKNQERGHADRGWLKSYFTFSFADYHDPSHSGFRALRVINDDRIAPGKGFGPHAHRDMEILTYVLDGKLLHRDSMGERHTVGPNEVQAMSAGTGIVHSEFNASEVEPVHLIQIWIEPEQEDLPPGYQQIAFAASEKRGHFRLLAGPEASTSEPSTIIHQDALFYVADLDPGETVTHRLRPERYAWAHIVRGSAEFNGHVLKEGDGAAISAEQDLSFTGHKLGGRSPRKPDRAQPSEEGAEILLFDLP